MNPDWDGVMKGKAREPKLNPTAPRVPPEGPAENLRNALALLGALGALLAKDVRPAARVALETERQKMVDAVSQRIWRAIQQLETPK